MANADPFSMSTMLNALQHLRFAEPTRVETPATPPPRYDHPDHLLRSFSDGFYAVALTPRELEMRWMFNLMTKREQEEDAAAPFKEIISTLDRKELQRLAALMTSDSDYFMEIARNRNGSKRIQMLLGKSDDVDGLFSAAILRRFFHVMTDKYAFYVATRALRVFAEEKKKLMYEHTLHYALHLARDQHGCIALNEIITDSDHPIFRNLLLDIVAHNALWLSNDPCGNFVVQHVLQLSDLRCKQSVAVSLRGHYVDLSFKKYGSYIVERLLNTAEESIVTVVVVELLECDGDRLVRLARSDYGNFVVAKALRVTQMMNMADLFWGLVDNLRPFLHLLRRSRGTNIASILDSVQHSVSCSALSQTSLAMSIY